MEGYVTLQWVKKNVYPNIHAWVKDNEYEGVVKVGKTLYMPKVDADKLDADLKASCLLSEAVENTGISATSISKYVAEGVVNTILIGRRKRILLSELPKLTEHYNASPERSLEANRKNARIANRVRWSNHRNGNGSKPESPPSEELAQRAEAVARKRAKREARQPKPIPNTGLSWWPAP